ncbi:MAG: biosynthetic-type acetolactate synthase large subunit [Bacteroidales bacterium]|nr:biosynthetic-type acetolactate synthase large subunit [Bacteroidales bacterium]
MQEKIKGSEILLKALIDEGVETLFGYPGGQIMPVYDRLVDYENELKHVLVRHEQGAIHAAQGYARVSHRPGVVLVTSGPGATNVVTGIADAMTDSTPLVVISGQVALSALGTDAFQEADFIGLTSPITKWNYQIRHAEDITWAVARAFYIAKSGRPGPVVLDFTKDAQVELAEYIPKQCHFIRSYNPTPKPSEADLDKAVKLINGAKKPLVVYGQGVILSHAENELSEFITKGNIPAGSTMLGLSALPNSHPLYMGMIGMHGNIAPNVKTNECDLLIAIGMRFDDRVTGVVSKYARQAKVLHIDIDAAEIGKIVPVEVGLLGDAAEVLRQLIAKMKKGNHKEWIESFEDCKALEMEKVIRPELEPEEDIITMGEVVDMVSKISENQAIVVTDVGQNQLMAARYSRFNNSRSFISSGGLGTMGFGLPAAIGAKMAAPGRPVCLFVGDGGIQMTMQEFGTIMQERTGVKVFILNNNWLGNVRQWQELFFGERYSQTRMLNPDYEKIASAYGIDSCVVYKKSELESAIKEALSNNLPYILDIHVQEDGMVMPMIAPGKSLSEIMINQNEYYG